MTELTPRKKTADKIAELERRLKWVEGIAAQYADMYQQLERKIKTLNDRHGNIQAVYDYMTQIGSTLTRKNSHQHGFLNPKNALDNKPLEIECDE